MLHFESGAAVSESSREASVRQRERRLPRFAWQLGAIVVVCTLAARVVAIWVLADMPHVMDEIAYDLQARMYAQGFAAGLPVEPLAAFSQWFIEDRGSRYGIFPPGWPAVLALGHLLGLAGWVNPLLHGATVWGVGRLGQRLAGARAGLVAALLYGLCPQAIAQGASRMSHTLSALLALLVLAPVVVALARPSEPKTSFLPAGVEARRVPAISVPALCVMGLSLGVLATARPVCAVCVAVAASIGLALCLAQGKISLRRSIWLALAALPPVIGLLAYNHLLVGSPFRFPQTRYFDSHAAPIDLPNIFRYGPGCNSLGFGRSHGCELIRGHQGHTALDALQDTLLNLTVLMKLGAACGVLALSALVTVLTPSTRRWASYLLLPLPLLMLAYATYWYAGVCYGARFYHAALPTFMVVAGAGFVLFRGKRALLRVAVVATVALYGLASYHVWRETHRSYWGTDERFIEYAERYQGPPAVVLVAFSTKGTRARRLSWTGMPVPEWVNGIRILSAQAANTPFLDGPLVFGRFHPALVQPVREQFPGRKVLVYVLTARAETDVVLPVEELRLKPPREGWEWPAVNFEDFILDRTDLPEGKRFP